MRTTGSRRRPRASSPAAWSSRCRRARRRGSAGTRAVPRSAASSDGRATRPGNNAGTCNFVAIRSPSLGFVSTAALMVSLASRSDMRPPAIAVWYSRQTLTGANMAQTQALTGGIPPRRGARDALRRDLGFWGTASLSVGGMAPTLAMSVTGVQAARLLGRAAPLAYVLAGVGMLLIGYGFVRLSAAFSHAGSVYAFIGKTLGPRAGFFATWMLIGTYIVFPPVSVLGMAAFTQAFLRHAGITTSSDWLPIALVSWVVVWLLVSRGIKLTARSVIAVEAVSLLLIAALIVVIYLRLGVGRPPGRQMLTGDVFKIPPGTGLSTIALAGTFGILSFGGFESAISAGEESHRPTHVIPRSIVAAVLFGAVFYVFCISGQMLGFGADTIGVSQFGHSSAPLGDLARTYVGRAMADLLDVAAVLSSLGAALVGVAVASRTLYALARDRLLASRISAISRHTGTPVGAVAASMALHARRAAGIRPCRHQRAGRVLLPGDDRDAESPRPICTRQRQRAPARGAPHGPPPAARSAASSRRSARRPIRAVSQSDPSPRVPLQPLPVHRCRLARARWCAGAIRPGAAAPRRPRPRGALASAPTDDQVGDEAGPAGLVRGAEARAGVAVEVLVEGDQSRPARVGLELVGSRRTPGGGRRASAGRCRSAGGASSSATSARSSSVPDPGRVLDVEVVAEVAVRSAQSLDDEVVDREPDRSAPVGVAAEQAGGRLAGLVVDACRHAAEVDVQGMVAWCSARARAGRAATGTRSRRAAARGSGAAARGDTIDEQPPTCRVRRLGVLDDMAAARAGWLDEPLQAGS